MDQQKSKKVVLIVAHPDDESLWAGGTILSQPSWDCFVVCLCRKNDEDRAPKFFKVLNALGANGIMGDLDDGPEQTPLTEDDVEQAIKQLMPSFSFDLIITHNPAGEYTRHRRHEEIGRAVINLWASRTISAPELWTFAYEDGHRAYYPRPLLNASFCNQLSKEIWAQKYHLITKVYGFNEDSWEANTTPAAEAFWQFLNPADALRRMLEGGMAV